MSTILLVDGDPLQALVRKSILETKFHNVRRVSDAVEALCLVEQPKFAEILGMVISSHHVTAMTGPAFVAELHARIPALPVLVLGDDGDNPSDYKGEQVHFLSRPFAKEALLAATSMMLKQNAHQISHFRPFHLLSQVILLGDIDHTLKAYDGQRIALSGRPREVGPHLRARIILEIR